MSVVKKCTVTIDVIAQMSGILTFERRGRGSGVLLCG